MSTIIKNRPLRLVCVDTGLRIVRLWLTNSGALHLQVWGVGRVMHLSDGRTALSCARRCWAHLAHRTPQCLAPERLLGREFRSPIWQWRVVRRRAQIMWPDVGHSNTFEKIKDLYCHPNIEMLLPYIDRRLLTVQAQESIRKKSTPVPFKKKIRTPLCLLVSPLQQIVWNA